MDNYKLLGELVSCISTKDEGLYGLRIDLDKIKKSSEIKKSRTKHGILDVCVFYVYIVVTKYDDACFYEPGKPSCLVCYNKNEANKALFFEISSKHFSVSYATVLEFELDEY